MGRNETLRWKSLRDFCSHISAQTVSASGCVATKKKKQFGRLKKTLKPSEMLLAALKSNTHTQKREWRAAECEDASKEGEEEEEKEESEDSGSTRVEGCQHFVDGMLQ